MFKLKIILLLLSFGYTISFAQLAGVVKDSKTDKPIFGAIVLISGTIKGCSTDADGKFEIKNIPAGRSKLIFSYIGFTEDSLIIDSSDPNSKNITMFLKQSFLKMNEIVVTSTRTGSYLKNVPVTTHVIKSDELQSIGATNVSEALEWIGGLNLGQSRFGTDLEIQGIGAKQVLVMVDGVKLVGRLNDQFDLSQLPASCVERIEVVKGGSSAIYGSEAMGGVVNIITKSPKEFFAFQTKTDFGSYGRMNLNIDAHIPLGNWRSAYLFSIRKYDGYDLDKSTIYQEGSAFTKYDGLIKIDGSFEGVGNVGFSAGYFKEDQRLISNEIFKDFTYNERKNISGKLQSDFTEKLKMNVNLEIIDYYHRLDQEVLSSHYIIRGGENKDRLIKGEILVDNELYDHHILLGYGHEFENSETERILNTKQSTSLNNIFAQDQYKISNLFDAVFGLRYDHHSTYGDQFSPKISLMYSPLANARIRINYGSGFRAPTFKELYLDYNNSSVGYKVFGNTELKPEISYSLNFNTEYWVNDDWALKLNLFYNKIKNLIDYAFFENNDGIATYKANNIESVKTWGGEFELKFSLFKNIEQTISYNYTDTYDELIKESLSFRSKHRGNLITRWIINKFADLQLRQQFYSEQTFYGEDVVENSGKNSIPGRYLVAVYTTFNLPYNIILTGGVKNLTDQVDKLWGPMPGREFYIGLQYDFKNK
jgi:outer membrane receptor for ferrienterochelin and colicins